MPDTEASIRSFLSGTVFAVAGASKDRAKFGNKVLRCYRQNGRKVYGISRKATEIEGVPCVPDVASLPEPVHGLSIVTPPPVTEKIVEDAAQAGIRHVWMQPGAESGRAVARAKELGLDVIANGPCVLVALGFREEA